MRCHEVAAATYDPGISVEKQVTYCRICEPLCGLVATVENGWVQSLRPDPD